MADTNRALQSRRMLVSLVEDTRKSQVRLLTSTERYNTLKHDISALETRLAVLQQELHQKKAIVGAAKEEMEQMTERIKYNEEKKTGLCIR